MLWTRPIVQACLGAVVALAVGCSKDPNQTKLTYMPDMADGPVAKPQREFLNPPEGSVAMNAILYPKDPDEAGLKLENPLSQVADKTVLRRQGKELYMQVCVACHGPQAKGDGSIIQGTNFPPPPDITSAVYRAKPDGFIFHRITFGSAIMPPQHDKLDPMERWKVVLYLRELQEQSVTKG